MNLHSIEKQQHVAENRNTERNSYKSASPQLQGVATGATAGAVEALALYWTNIRRVAAQLDKPMPTTLRGHYAGLPLGMALNIPLFAAIHGTKMAFASDDDEVPSPEKKVAIALCSAANATFFLTPMENVLVKMKLHQQGWQPVMKTMYRDQGLRPFYHATSLAYARNGAYCLGLYVLTPQLSKALGDPEGKDPKKVIAAASTSGALCCMATHPLDVAMTHIRSKPQMTLKAICEDVFAKKGWKGFTAGLAPRLVRIGGGSGLVTGVFMACDHLMTKAEGKQ